MKRLRVPDLASMKERAERIVMLTAYDTTMARLFDRAGVDLLLVGDSLGQVMLGLETTIPVTLDAMVHHTAAVARGAERALVVADMPFLTYQITPELAMQNAGRLFQEGGAAAVKLEGGRAITEAVRRLTEAGLPVMGHVGLTPQHVHSLGGMRRQARTDEAAHELILDALALQDAGAFAIVLESIPEDVAKAATAALRVPTIGIGAGPWCDGQVLVGYDVLGLSGNSAPPFAKQYAQLGDEAVRAAESFAHEVREGAFPFRMQVIAKIAELRERLNAERAGGSSIGFVPTMGALHAGHASLLKRARAENDFVVASIFVNPLQFDRKADLETYPRTMAADLETCTACGTDLVFAPDATDLYPAEQLTFVDVPALSESLCGASRPGHFRGVATVVLKLFNIVQADKAYFGEKDAQQLAVIRRMVHDLNVPIEVVPVATVREADGLAMSSRNKHLTAAQRANAVVLARAMRAALGLFDAGEKSVAEVTARVLPMFAEVPECRLEYFEVVDPATLRPVERAEHPVLVIGAMWMGTTRLIDNMLWPNSGARTS